MAIITNNNINSFLNTYRASGMPQYGDNSNLDNLVATSTNIVIKSNNIPIGMVQSMQVSESRSIDKLNEIGRLGVIQAVPGNTNGGSISTSRIALARKNIFEALQLSPPPGDTNIFATLRQQEIPFEIRVEVIPAGASGNQISASEIDQYCETYVDCWLSSYGKSYAVDTITVTETAKIEYGDIL